MLEAKGALILPQTALFRLQRASQAAKGFARCFGRGSKRRFGRSLRIGDRPIRSLDRGVPANQIVRFNHAVHRYNLSTYKVSMKFAVAFVVGDTELHDKLCGRYGSHNNTKYACRHCNCKTEDVVNPTAQDLTTLWSPEDFCRRTHEVTSDYWKSVSHHPIDNAFDCINFGSNHHKIHFATPGESLHMHQL